MVLTTIVAAFGDNELRGKNTRKENGKKNANPEVFFVSFFRSLRDLCVQIDQENGIDAYGTWKFLSVNVKEIKSKGKWKNSLTSW